MLAKIDVSQTWSPSNNPAVPQRIEIEVNEKFVEMVRYLRKRAEEFKCDHLLCFAYVDQFLHNDTKFEWKRTDGQTLTTDHSTILRFGVEEWFIRFIGIDVDDGSADPYLMWESIEFDPDDLIAAWEAGESEYSIKWNVEATS